MIAITMGWLSIHTVYVKSFKGENYHSFRGFLLTANVLPLKFFLEYQCHPLTTQSMVQPGLKFSITKVFPTYYALVMNRKSFPPNDLTYTVYDTLSFTIFSAL